MISVIIPAYNEAGVIETTLRSLLACDSADSAEVIVVCNGCTDDTAERARRFAPRVRVVETAVPSKTAALNLGDQHASGFPRVYMDADILVSPNLLCELTEALRDESTLVAWPSVEHDLTICSYAVRGFYTVWRAMPYNTPGRIGVGVYALSRVGRERFGQFPPIISDDGYVRGLFREDESRIVETCSTIVRPPSTLGSLISVRTRTRLGIYQLRRDFPEVIRRHRSSTSVLSVLRAFAALWTLSALPVYLWVNFVTRIRAARRINQVDRYKWERDDSTRRRPKLLAIASRGGHWIQLLRLREAFDGVDVTFVTTVPEYHTMVQGARFRTVIEATRMQKFRLVLLLLQIFWVLLRERPDAIVTTGAAPGFFAVRLGKLFGARTMWIDSIANAEQLSLSGRLAARHARVILTQWAHLASPGVEYHGAVI